MHHAAPTQALSSSSHAQPFPHASPRELQPPPSLSAAHNNKCAPFRLYHPGLPHTLLNHKPRRVQAQYGSAAVKQRPGTALDDGLDPNSIPVDVNAIPLGARTAKPPREPVPEVEWWDRALLLGAKGEQQYATSMSEDGQEVRALLPCLVCAQLPVLQRWVRLAVGHQAFHIPLVQLLVCRAQPAWQVCGHLKHMVLRDIARLCALTSALLTKAGMTQVPVFNTDAITWYVQHPVPIEPPAEEQPPAAMPLMLTKKVHLALPRLASSTSRASLHLPWNTGWLQSPPSVPAGQKYSCMQQCCRV